ncbi:hypothetical protein F5B22DRAFT_582212 [Xylaria bambusicola]|uniref:uncharacterized protein n=1 Tax=Xylaria bambusicola TaxID=326684 RepID=UPI0020072E67|nr:uncharacterized protein F5B22DRAFT_582212 [Xylaria bambusicola]KAI0527759.1 hypothetical protein F5B22DRAFT_582212 [Xylaria bambusicola]
MVKTVKLSPTHTWLYIISQGTIWRNIYFVNSSIIQTCLRGKKDIDHIFETLYNVADKRTWTVEDDVIDPFVAPITRERDAVQAVWLFDLNTKHVQCHVQGSTYEGHLEFLLSPDLSMQNGKYVVAQRAHLLRTPTTNVLYKRWTSHICAIERQRFTMKILTHFGLQWKHILCGRYNHLTFRRLATAIIKIVAMAFQVVEGVLPVEPGIRGDVAVCVHELPKWKPFQKSVIPTCGIPVVICREVPAAIQMIYSYIGKGEVDHNSYLILTVREVLLFHLRDMFGMPGVVKVTSLFDNGQWIPSRSGIDLLLQAITGPELINNGCLKNHHLDRHQIENLKVQSPVEQDVALNSMSGVPLERRRLAVALGIGLKNYDTIEPTRLYEGDENATKGTVVNQIWFECFSGLAYIVCPRIVVTD